MAHAEIEINGVRYNAVTGAILPKKPSGTIEGIVQKTPTPQILFPTKKTSAPAVRPTRLMQDITTHKRHTPQKSQTLMRTIVKKPLASQKHVQDVLTDQPLSRETRAQTVPKHSSVARFNTSPPQNVPAKVTSLPVAVHPNTNSTSAAPHITAFTNGPRASEQSLASKFVDSQLQKAINHSTKPLKQKKSKAKLASVGAGILSALLLVGFIAYLNAPSINVAFVSKKAGVAMSIPKGIPSNFAVDRRIDYYPGAIEIRFKSRTDERMFSIAKQNSKDMTFESLESSISQKVNGKYQVYESNGLKILMADSGRAEWLSGGMLYSINGDSQLANEQIATIAKNL